MTQPANPDHDLLDAIFALAPVGLTEVVGSANLQTRQDRKYVVPLHDITVLINDLPAESRVLTIDDRTQFTYCSAYFDTDDRKSYLGAAYRRPSRFKVRVRTYVESKVSMLEVKTRDNRGRTVKNRIASAPTAEIVLSPAARGFVAGFVPTAEVAADLRPALTTTYRRSTLLPRTGQNVRVTVDTELAWFDTNGRRQEFGPYAIVETKTEGGVCDFDRALWRAGHRPISFSKYCTGMAALDPSLPANRWHRVLRRYLSS